MESTPRIEVGPVVHAWGPFRVRSQTLVTRDGRHLPLPTSVVSIMLGADDEHRFAHLARSADTLPDLVTVLRKRLGDLARDIKSWDQHLHEMQYPEERAALQAKLDDEAHARNHHAEQVGQGGGEEGHSAAQVLSNQQDEQRRIQYLYEAIQVGLRELEEEFPELGSQ